MSVSGMGSGGGSTGIADVAARSGFSPATVSRALRGMPGVSVATRTAVERAAAELGYAPSPWATALTTGRTNAVGIVAPSVSRWFLGTVLDGALDVLGPAGFDVVLYPLGTGGSLGSMLSGDDADREPTARGADPRAPAEPRPPSARGADLRALNKRVDGLIALNVPLVDPGVSLRDLRVPVVTVGIALEGLAGVLVDNVRVGRTATRHLVDLGHRRVAFVGDERTGGPGQSVGGDRYRGYRDALEQAGIRPDPTLLERTGFSVAGGEAALDGLLERGGGRGGRESAPTAVFAVSDEVAMGVLYAARGRGISVPEDLSVIGVDGHDFAYLFGLTTVAQPVREQGRIAAELLVEQLNARKACATLVPVESRLVERESTGPAPAG